MNNIDAIDPGRKIDWGKTSIDYAEHRPGPPSSVYNRIQSLGYAKSGSHLLDLGTGTGVIAREFARRNVCCTGIDISAEQITTAREISKKENLDITFINTSVENASLEENQYDTITANQCWLYFDHSISIPFVKKHLNKEGVLITSHFSWLPRLDKIAKASEDLILKHNPSWTAANWSGEIPAFPKWAQKDFSLKAMFTYDVPIHFNHESWRGRIRACRGIGAALPLSEVKQFDDEHDRLLKKLVKNDFTVLHRIDAHIFEPV
jgi:2-polyprenyl-3-methyl-5-hydroxy-6-metoxy-1,4-benzoquinol methylase